MFRQSVHPHVHKISHILKDHGFQGFLVGGAVRDLLLGDKPKDYDLSTDATPEELKKIFGRQARIIGRRFRLVHICYGKEVYEVSTFRRKPSAIERQGRKDDDGVMLWRDNEFGSLEEDAFRRDFTVNALFYDPITDTIEDLVDGRTDMNNSLVRAIGDPEERLLEDPVRMIRAIKLMAQYHFSLEEGLEAAVRKHSSQIALASKARLFEEILKIMNKPYAFRSFDLLHQYGILKHIMPGLDYEWQYENRHIVQRMLQVRDQRKMSANFYSNSRVLALATICFEPLRQLARIHTAAEHEIWQYKDNVDSLIRKATFDFFHGVVIPKFVRTRLSSIINAIPRFMSSKKRSVLLNHKDYYYARELFLVWLTATDGDLSILDKWPKKRPEQPAHHNKKSHPKRRRRRRSRPQGSSNQ